MEVGNSDEEQDYTLDSVVLGVVDVDTYYTGHVDMAGFDYQLVDIDFDYELVDIDFDYQLVDIEFEVMDIEKNLNMNIL